MSTEDERFLQRLLATFKLEAEEHLGALSAQLLQLERSPAPEQAASVVEALFREAHSLKGAARSVNLADIERVCQALERVLSALKRHETAVSRELFDTLHSTLDVLGQLLSHHVDGGAAPEPALAVDAAQRLNALLAASLPAGHSPQPLSPVASAAAAGAEPIAVARPPGDTVRVATAKLEALMVQAEDLQAFKFSGEHLGHELHALAQGLADWKRRWDKDARQARMLRRARARAGAPDGANGGNARLLARLLDGIEHHELRAKSLSDRLAQLQRAAAQEQRGLATRADKLLEDMKQVLMLPFAALLDTLPRQVRDLAQASGKEAELIVSGATLEADRRILEQLKTPLLHLVRNAIDHGIETPEERLRLNKPRRGLIRIDVVPREGNRVEMLVADDGAGIALDKVRAKAQRLGLTGALGTLDDRQARDLVFESGLSTSPILTDLSGHGLGLAIVREKIDRLGGSIELQRGEPGQGTRFRVVLPATLATFRGLLVRLADRRFVLPARHVERVLRVARSAIRSVENSEAIEVEQSVVALVSLAGVLGLPPAAPDGERVDPPVQVVVLTHGDRRMAFEVDEVLGDQEVLVKPLTPPLKRVRNVAGATVLGAGHVVPLLDVADLMRPAPHGHARRPAASPAGAAAGRRMSLLVAEDSVTSRDQLKHILETAGYRVTTAADGIDALSCLQSGDFDLLVSDVEMPRLDGFDLTARVRTDKRLADLPVVLVTALDSRADKERGVEVGANAYIVKSGFDKAHLLDAIRTLI
ncbi:hybrid sensor histidine kinase/response regulator [Piscinibacter sp.]|uniref:hybrid sensor histidine kinase/response regulator n=1 Tax=Piscinibacter sp. TaxID=1903157 RepID=UPI002B7CDA97|nr:response regulator [Albitalea sp.]HUG24030.1 response regulator [Albitalea sp.]